MTVSTASIHSLSIALLAGGDSVRMGSPKHLLPDADGTPVYLSRLKMLRRAFPEAQDLCLLLRDSSQSPYTSIPPELSAHVLYVNASAPESRERGPGTTISTAFSFNPRPYWLFVPCDYPLLTASELRYLCDQYRDPITCFQNAQGSAEPLVAIWSPAALSHVATDAVWTRDHLAELVDKLGGSRISPLYDHSLCNANTREDWEDAIQLLAQSCNTASVDKS